MIEMYIVEVLNLFYLFGVCGIGETNIILFLGVVFIVVSDVIGIWMEVWFLFPMRVSGP